ncbi:MAG: filamentous hemagglutinin N-terminal domain-containing protein, partial [Phycisphaerales bacterium]|nr:filamentous hemagglutinin N-terminal domain-containing protein [Phycisphaerales bacterium]
MNSANRAMSRLALRCLAVCGLAAGVAIGNPGEDDVDGTQGEVQFIWEDGYLTIISADGTIIDWLNFDIGEGETIEFILPGLDARVLNRILSGVPTEIMGNLLSNGQVYIANPSGVIFGNNAVVNVGALYAAAGNISNDDFIAGVNRFTDARGVVENRGLLQGDLIALIGGRVANHGTISAPMGTVILAAGEQVLIGEHLGSIYVQLLKPSDLETTDQLSSMGSGGVDLAAGDVFSLAAWNTGTINAGNVQMVAGSGTMMVSGSINASMGDLGGDVSLIGDDVQVLGASINATGASGGGSLLVRGNRIRIDDAQAGDGPARGEGIVAGEIELVAMGENAIVLGTNLLATDGTVIVDGDLVLVDDVSIVSLGDDAGIEMLGAIDSEIGGFHSLLLSAVDGTVNLGGPVGTAGSDARLGMLEVHAELARVGGDVFVRDGMSFYTPVAVYADSVTFHTGDGSALFADDIYSEEIGMSDVAFLYDGIAFAGDGEARTPFKFRGNIGIGPAVGPFDVVGGDFGTIRFGDDLNTPSSAVAFMFADGASAGNGLMNGSDVNLDSLFRIAARESIIMGRGQKMLSFGSLSMSAKGPGTTLVELGDVNVLGDLLVTSLGFEGGEIRLLGRVGSLVDSRESEGDRENGIIDEGAEIIALGSITMIGDVSVDGGIARLGGTSVRIANNDGSGSVGDLDIEIFPGGVSLELFRSVLEGDGGGVIYPYDLFLLSAADDPEPQADLATSFADDDRIAVRDDPALLAGREVLAELSLNPRDPSYDTQHNEQHMGGARHDKMKAADFGVTIDRLSPRSVRRLVGAYVGLLG